MKAAPPPRQAERLAALARYAILDTPRESDYDDVVRLASAICDAPIAVINLIDRDRQWFKAEVGLGVRETPLDTSICAHAILQDEFVVVPDLLADARFCDNPLCLDEPRLRFYAGALLRTPDGHPIGTLCVLDRRPRDLDPLQREALRVLAAQVTKQMELRRALAEQQRLTAALASEAERKDEFIATLAHELMNPLAPVVTSLALLDRIDAPAGPARTARDVIRRQTALMGRLVGDLLDLARVRQGRVELRLAPVETSAIVERAVEIARPAIDRAGHALSVDLTESADVVLQADAQRLVQVLVNLLSNAARYTPRGGAIRVSTRRDGADAACIRVSDDGVGLSPDSLERIFGLFEQAGAPGHAGGLGIGLALARRLVELHGGTLTAASDGPGRGSTFEVRLPLRR